MTIIHISARTFFSRMGHTYYSAVMIIDGEEYIVTDMDGGSGEQTMILECLDCAVRNGWIDAGRLPAEGEPLWRWRERKGNRLTIHITEVCREKDLRWSIGRKKIGLYDKR